MPDPLKPVSTDISAIPNPTGAPSCHTNSPADKVVCERCGKAEMFRMHAVWRCPACGYKTDCCGW